MAQREFGISFQVRQTLLLQVKGGIRHEENQEKGETVRKTVLVLGKPGTGSYEGVRRSGIRRERIQGIRR